MIKILQKYQICILKKSNLHIHRQVVYLFIRKAKGKRFVGPNTKII